MYSPRPLPILTGLTAERSAQMRIEAEQTNAPRYNLKSAKSMFTAIMERSKRQTK